MTRIRLTSLTKRFGTRLALDHLDLTFEAGGFTVLVGPSGCGKTTTLRLIAGLETPSAGGVSFSGEDVTPLAPRDRDVAVVFQQYSLYGHLNVRENLIFGLRARRSAPARIARRLERVAAMLRIGHLLEHRPAQLSGGEQQRVAIGRALARDPRVFLFDEPLSNLDAALRLELRSEIIRMHQEVGTTTAYVTHGQAEALAMADTLVVMNQGRCVQKGSPLTVYHHPADTFVARFIGSPPMNLISGEIVREKERLWFDHPGGRLPLNASPDCPRLAGGGDASRRAILGVRPEHLALSTSRDPSQTTVQNPERHLTDASTPKSWVRPPTCWTSSPPCSWPKKSSGFSRCSGS